MTPSRLSEIQIYLCWSDTQTANTLGVRRSTVRAWWRDNQRIPEDIAAGLEGIVAVVERVRAGKPSESTPTPRT